MRHAVTPRTKEEPDKAIKINNLKLENMKLIGKGLFSKVYKINEKEVLIKSVCYVKECIALFADSCGVFPSLERVDYQEYKCEYFEKVRSLKTELSPAHYKIYLELRSLSVGVVRNEYDYADAWRWQFKKLSNKKYRDALLYMVDELGNYGTDVMFEISPRNVAVKNGKLVLLDVFFIRSQAKEIRKEGVKKYAY